MSRQLLNSLAAGALCLAAFTTIARADNLVASFTTAPQAWVGNLAQPIRLSSGGALAIPFNNPLAGLVAVTYTAECQLNAAPSSWLHVSVVIDGVVASPTGPDAAFCSGRAAGATGWARHSVTVARVLAAGLHSVSVRGQVNGVHAGARLDDTTILIGR